MHMPKHLLASGAALAVIVAIAGAGGAVAGALIDGHRIARHTIEANRLTSRAISSLHGATGAKGATGAGLFGTVPSGQTLTGVFVVQQGYEALGTGVTVVSFQQKFSQGLAAEWVLPGVPTANCPGTPAAPTAAKGHFCAYLVQDTGHLNNISDPASTSPPTNTTGKLGAILIGDVGSGNQVALSGSWAATAP